MSKKVFLIPIVIFLLSTVLIGLFFFSTVKSEKNSSIELVKENIKFAKNIDEAKQIIKQTYGEPDEHVGCGIKWSTMSIQQNQYQ